MKIFAHRGASGEYPENTLLAYEQAIQQNCDGIELDIQYHHSGEFILLHDNYLLHDNGVKNSATSYTHFNQLPLHELLNSEVNQGKNIFTLSQALKLISGRCIVNIEIKSATCDHDKIEKVLNLLEKQLHQAVNENNFCFSQFIISSFNHPILLAIKLKQPQLATAALIASCPISYALLAEEIKAQALNPCINCLNKTLVDDAHQRALKVYVYTVDKYDELEKCVRLGVDGIFTNYPKQSRIKLAQITKSNR